MATLYGLLKGFTGSMDNVTFKKREGITITSLKIEKTGRYVATKSQAAVSMRFGNLVNLWGEFAGNLHPSFQYVKSLSSDYNTWVKRNMQCPAVYLTKSEFDQGGCVLGPYFASYGKLHQILTSTDTGGIISTNIELGSTFSITAATTLGAFSTAVITANGNSRFQNGDVIAAYKAVQTVDDGIPHVSITASKVQLNINDSTTLLRSLVDADCFSVVNGKLGAGATVNGGIAWVQSRRDGTKTLVSTSKFAVTNTNLAAYQTQTRMEAAARSYGTLKSTEYLTPDSDDEADVDTGVTNP